MKIKIFGALVGLILAASLCFILPAMTVAADTINGKIAFTSDRTGYSEIYVMNADGTAQTQLTTTPGDNYHPAWSPDGKRIAYSSDPDGDWTNWQIYVMNADGSNQVNLTNNSSNNYDPGWSPDGTHIVFRSDRSGLEQIYVMNSDGTNPLCLTTTIMGNMNPAWSPDGTKIVFSSGRDGNYEIYSMQADGTGQTRLTQNTFSDLEPAWSPDGLKISFRSNRDGNNEIYTMNPDGTILARLTNNATNDFCPAWSPDGAKIAFQTDRDGTGNQEVYVMNPDGSSPQRLTNNPAVEGQPAWGARSLPVPQITSFTPAFGGDGTVVTITGSGFTGAFEVSFATVGAQYTVDSDSQITATLEGGDPGQAEVRTPGGDAVSTQNFEYYPQPTITAAPASARQGDSVTLTGAFFPTDLSRVSVKFGTDAQVNGGVSGTITAVGGTVSQYGGLTEVGTSLTVTVGAGASGYIAVTSPGGVAVYGGFTYVPTDSSVTLSNLNQTYDGTPKLVTATTNPSGLAVSITYGGSTTPPTNVGSYAVVGTITDPAYTGSASGTLLIKPIWDVNGDRIGNYLDIVRIGLVWNTTGAHGWIPEDVNRDGVINVIDIVLVGLHWQGTW